ncbi:hypothetical protein [Vibrio sp. EA2]|uniref:hypothetical protein n=1 Tax=Vibrio sp. EA2 TaxID=3079860 RepID=UPI00294A2966|nr:hypothetical protein [Vibrio sp. EA2]MDV6253985.1 hypothetical protein [Vibrio sp. EA2]
MSEFWHDILTLTHCKVRISQRDAKQDVIRLFLYLPVTDYAMLLYFATFITYNPNTQYKKQPIVYKPYANFAVDILSSDELDFTKGGTNLDQYLNEDIKKPAQGAGFYQL